MTTSSQMVAQMVSSTGQLITEFLPFFYVFLGLLISLFALVTIYKSFKNGFSKF